MTTIWDVIAMIAAVVGGLIVLSGFSPSASAPQQAAAAALGIGVAAIPYFISSIARRGQISDRLKQLTDSDRSE